jgi:hypothetical protein
LLKKKKVHDWIAFAKDSIPNFLCILTYIHVVEVPTETHVCGGAIMLSKSSLIPKDEEEEEEE